MTRATRFFLSLALILAAPGLSPYRAAAQVLGAARVAVPAGSIGAAGASINAAGAAGLALPGASLQTGLIPSLAPSAALAPALTLPAAAAPAIAAPATPAALKAAAVAAAAPAEKAAAPAAALTVLRTGTSALGAAVKTGAAEAPRAALDGLFEGSSARPEALAVAGRSAASASPRLDRPEARAPQGPRWVKTLRGPNDRPATSIKRTLSVGFLAAVVPIAITLVTVVIAQLLGYTLHPNYVGPDAGAMPTILSALGMFVGAAVMAPVSEEAIFRGGLQKKISQITAKLHVGDFVIPAAVTSLIFVALHETSDPVLFFTRFVHAMVLSYVYRKEGILASMAAHGFFNGLLSLSVVFTALGLPWLALAVAPAALYYALKAAKTLRAQKPDIASGALAPKPLGAALAFVMAAVLLAGYLFLMPNIFWAVGAVALAVKGIMELVKARKSGKA